MKNGKFFFNDVEVSEADYKKLIKDAETHYALLEEAKARKVAEEAAMEKSKPKAKKKVKAKAYVSPEKEIAKVKAEKPAKGTKTEIAKSVMLEVGVANKAACIEKIMEVLSVTKGNASCYYANVCKKL